MAIQHNKLFFKKYLILQQAKVLMNQKQISRFEKFSENCPECAGVGTITRFYGGGIYTSIIDCERCRGRGRLGNCPSCGGTGAIGVDEPCQACHAVGSRGDCTPCSGTGLQSTNTDEACSSCDGFGFSGDAEA